LHAAICYLLVNREVPALPPRTLIVTVYVRHAADCTTNEPYWKRCKCPKWLYINCDGQRSQRSAKTRSWERAEEERRKLEREFEAKQDGRKNTVHSGKETNVSLTNVSLETAVDRFLASKRKQNLADSTVSKLKAIFKRQLLDWTKQEDISLVAEIQVCDLENFRETLLGELKCHGKHPYGREIQVCAVP
jgi:integrase/recombinase XerD